MKYLKSRAAGAGSCLVRGALGPLWVGASAAAFALVMWPSSAAAQTTLGVDLSFNDAVDQSDTDAGAGIDIYFGPRLDLAILTLTTELAGGYHDFAGPFEPTVYRALAGGRLGVGVGVRASVFAHLGVGHLRYDELIGTDRESHTDFAGDLGLALDFTVLPLVDVGVQGSYNMIAAGGNVDAFEWYQAGAHVIFVLGDS
jgi:hypothetical protein